MRTDKDLFGPLHWTIEFKDKCVIYMLEWSGKRYVGSTTNLRVRLHSHRSELKFRGVTRCRVLGMKVVTLSERFLLEERNIDKFNTEEPTGHNRSSCGKGRGYGRHPSKEIPAQLPGVKEFDIARSSKWALEFAGKCVVYTLEWDNKRYVGSSSSLRDRIDVHRRRLALLEKEGRVIEVRIVPENCRSEEETKAILENNTLHPTGHNRSSNGGFRADWGNQTYRDLQAEAWKDPSRKRRMSATMKELWEDPEYRARQKSSFTPERKSSHNKKIKEWWSTPENKQKALTRLKDPILEAERRRKTSEKLKELWSDPVFRENMLASRKSCRKANCED